MPAGRSKWRRRLVLFNGQADVALISPDAYLGEWSTHFLPLLPLSLISFCHLSLSTHVTYVTGCNIEGARKSGVGVREGEGVRHCSVHM